jgi:hypothetical protein
MAGTQLALLRGTASDNFPTGANRVGLLPLRCALRRFMPVTAVPETAFRGQRFNVYEGSAETCLNRANLKLAHSRCVN